MEDHTKSKDIYVWLKKKIQVDLSECAFLLAEEGEEEKKEKNSINPLV